MEFENIDEGNDCACLTGAVEDTTSAFFRYIDSPSAKERDFLSKWDRYKKQGAETPKNIDCEEICGLKGLSMNKVDGYDEAEVFAVYTAPYLYVSEKERKKKLVLKFTLGNDVGLVKHTPNNDHDSHHDLFKCDTFDIANIKTISVSRIEFD